MSHLHEVVDVQRRGIRSIVGTSLRHLRSAHPRTIPEIALGTPYRHGPPYPLEGLWGSLSALFLNLKLPNTPLWVYLNTDRQGLFNFE